MAQPASLSLLKGKGKTEAAPVAEQKTEPKKPNISLTKKPVPSISASADKPKEDVPQQVPAPATPQPTPATPPVETPPAEPPPATAAEDTVVDVDKMSSKELDKLCADNGIDTPANWGEMKVAEKRLWLKAQFPEDGAEEVTPTPPPAKAEKAPKTKAVAAPAKSGEIMEPDELADIVHSVENLKKDEALKLVHELAETAEFTYFKLGGVLSKVQSDGWFDPHANFKEFVESVHGINYRKAMYWIQIYNDLAESKVPWVKVKDVGWTKLKEIAGILSPENVDAWVEKAKSLTTMMLIDAVAASKAQAIGKATAEQVEGQEVKPVTTRTFKVHEDQKATIEAALAKAKEAAGTQVDTVALEYICLDFLGSKPHTSDLTVALKTAGIEAALESLGKAFPDTDFSVATPEAA